MEREVACPYICTSPGITSTQTDNISPPTVQEHALLAGKPGNQQDTDAISHKSTGQSDAGEYLGFVQIESHTFGIADNRIDGNHLGRHMKEDGEYS